jgi:predicted ATPase
MIRKVIVQNLKRFALLEFELPEHLVIAGPNNSGKTTVLQAVAAWSEIAFQWLQNNPEPARKQDGNYPEINLNILNFHSIPLADFKHLWRGKNVNSTAAIWLHTDQWKIGFEILYKEKELAATRPVRDVKETDLKEYIQAPLIPAYIPPFSQLELNEAQFDPIVVKARLAEAKGSSILRNLLLLVSQNKQKWEKLQDVIRSFFGYELSPPSSGTKIFARYQHSETGEQYDLSSAASGFLQVLMIYASLLHDGVPVVLVDEPDAHLHILLQQKIYRDLSEHAYQNKTQLIIATHSEQIIDTADEEGLYILTGAGQLRKLSNRKKVKGILRLENTEISLAATEPGILYVEGKTDIDILREWARILGHPLLAFLEKPFWRATAEEKNTNRFALRHFDAMHSVVPDFRGLELRDGDQRAGPGSLPDGMIRLHWERYEIESYLIHPGAIIRIVEKDKSTNIAHRVDDYMKQQLPPVLYDNPSETSGFLLQVKGKTLLAGIMQEAGMDMKESDYYRIAARMNEKEIHPEVVGKLNTIAQHFGVMGEGM